RFGRTDKRNKLPKWINQYITDSATNLSTDMSLDRAKKFLRSMAQPFDDQRGVSLWTLEDIIAKQRNPSSHLNNNFGGRMIQ
ncbi:11079_t:CDS:1, partial [Rhizophagus irregularis]